MELKITGLESVEEHAEAILKHIEEIKKLQKDVVWDSISVELDVKKDKAEKKPEPMHYECPCGKTQHYADAKYCTSCGRKIEKPQR